MPLKTATQTALQNNPDLRRTERAIAVAEENLKSARGQKGFSVSATGSGNFSKEILILNAHSVRRKNGKIMCDDFFAGEL